MGIIVIIGYIVAIVGMIMILIQAFQESVIWGIGCLLVPFVALIFVAMHWEETKKGFLLQLAGVALIVVGVFAAGRSNAAIPVKNDVRMAASPTAQCRFTA